eukprot:11326118-Alexandrium_andersonii.AAC.1
MGVMSTRRDCPRDLVVGSLGQAGQLRGAWCTLQDNFLCSFCCLAPWSQHRRARCLQGGKRIEG